MWADSLNRLVDNLFQLFIAAGYLIFFGKGLESDFLQQSKGCDFGLSASLHSSNRENQ